MNRTNATTWGWFAILWWQVRWINVPETRLRSQTVMLEEDWRCSWIKRVARSAEVRAFLVVASSCDDAFQMRSRATKFNILASAYHGGSRALKIQICVFTRAEPMWNVLSSRNWIITYTEILTVRHSVENRWHVDGIREWQLEVYLFHILLRWRLRIGIHG